MNKIFLNVPGINKKRVRINEINQQLYIEVYILLDISGKNRAKHFEDIFLQYKLHELKTNATGMDQMTVPFGFHSE